MSGDARDGLGSLRRWTVVVLLALLCLVTIVEIVDGLFFGDVFHTDPAFYGLVGGMVTGLFAVEIVAAVRNGKNDG